MLKLLLVVKGLVEFAGFLLIGQLLVYMLSFGRHEENAVYKMMRFLTSPMTRVARAVTPGKVADRHVPFVAFFILFWIYVAVMAVIVTEYGPEYFRLKGGGAAGSGA